MDKSYFGIRMDSALDKEEIINIVRNTYRLNVLDLGAGTCNIGIKLSSYNITTTSVDSSFKATGIPQNEYHRVIRNDIVTFLKSYKDKADEDEENKFDCVILSAVLHELPSDIFMELPNLIRDVISDDCVILIREPYYEKRLFKFSPFKVGVDGNKIAMEICNSIPTKFETEYNTRKKKNEIDSFGNYTDKNIPISIRFLNLAFAYSYGNDSWDRESYEGRYVFTKRDLISFCKRCYYKKPKIMCKKYNNEDYRKYFKACDYSDRIFNSIEYTNCMIIAYGED